MRFQHLLIEYNVIVGRTSYIYAAAAMWHPSCRDRQYYCAKRRTFTSHASSISYRVSTPTLSNSNHYLIFLSCLFQFTWTMGWVGILISSFDFPPTSNWLVRILCCQDVSIVCFLEEEDMSIVYDSQFKYLILSLINRKKTLGCNSPQTSGVFFLFHLLRL